MPLVDMGDLLQHAYRSGYAVGVFEAPSLECLEAIITAAEECRSPVIISLTESHIAPDALACRMAALESVAQRTAVPIATHLNRGATYESAVRAIGLGCNSVMVDTADLAFPDNVAQTRRVADMAHGCGVHVEGTLGCLLGGEPEGQKTGKRSVDEVAAYVERTGIDCLSVAIGRVPPQGRSRLRIEFDHLKKIHEAVSVPLVLHSCAELTDEQYHKLILHGVAAIRAAAALNGSVNRTLLALLHAQEPEAVKVQDPPEVSSARAALTGKVEHCMRLWGSAGRAAEVLVQCQPWQAVEQVVLYNIEPENEAQAAAMMRYGQEVLSHIPGVRRVFAGRAIHDHGHNQGHYQYAWLVQFAHPKAIESYEKHPDHVAFVNQYLRPLAQDRIVIDLAAVESPAHSTQNLKPARAARTPNAGLVQG